MENCARYANDKMIDSDRLFFFFLVFTWRAEFSFLLFFALLYVLMGNGNDQKRLKKKPKKKKKKEGELWL